MKVRRGRTGSDERPPAKSAQVPEETLVASAAELTLLETDLLPDTSPGVASPAVEEGEPSLVALTDPTLAVFTGDPVYTIENTGDETPQPSRIRPVPIGAPSSDGPTIRWSPPTETVALGQRPEGEAEGAPHSGSRPRLPFVRVPEFRPDERRVKGQEDRPGLRDLRSREPEAARRGPTWRGALGLLLLLCAILGVGAALGRMMRQRRFQRLQQSAYDEAEAAHRRGELRGLLLAAARLSEILEQAPADGRALEERAYLLGEAHYELGGPSPRPEGRGLQEEAEQAARLVQTETGAAALAAQGYQALAAGDPTTAGERGEALLATAPASGLGDYLLGQAALLREQVAAAAAATERAAARRPERVLWQLRLAQLRRRIGRTRDAEEALAAALRLAGDHVGVRVERGCHATAEGAPGLPELVKDGRLSWSSAERVAAWLCLSERALSAAPPDPAAARAHLSQALSAVEPDATLQREQLGRQLLLAGDLLGAEREAGEVLRRLPARQAARLTLGQALLRRGQAEEALRVLAPLTEPPDAEAAPLVLKAQALLSLDQTLQALQIAEQAEAVAARAQDAAGRIDAQLLQARINVQLGDLQVARRLLQPLLAAPRLGAQHVEAQLVKAQLLLSAGPGQRAEARAHLEWLVARAPQLSEARLSLGRLLRAAGQLKEAREQLLESLRLEDRPAARRELAAVAMALSDYALARQQYELLLKGEEDDQLLLQAARAFKLSGDGEGAAALLHRMRKPPAP